MFASRSALSDLQEERDRLRLVEEVYEHDQSVIRQQQQVLPACVSSLAYFSVIWSNDPADSYLAEEVINET